MGRPDDERRDAARELRQQGASVRAIAEQIGASKSSVSVWCRDIELTEQQVMELSNKASVVNRAPRDTQWRRRRVVEAIQVEAARATAILSRSPLWAAGVALYWAEGGKTERRLSMANADPDLLRLFIRWTEEFHGLSEFSCSINLHADNNEEAARAYWSTELDIPAENFTKSYIKPNGTGHRKNHLDRGVARVSPRKSTDAWIRTMVWIQGMPEHL